MLCSIRIGRAAMALTFVVALGHPICLARLASYQREAPDADVRVLIDELATDQRETAKTRLVEIGIRAAPLLIARLRDLTDYVEDPRVAGDNTIKGFYAQHDPVLAATVSPSETAWDALEDCVELLGEMKSEEAVPAIIKSLEVRTQSGREPKLVHEIRALKKIGAPAVPALIDALARAPETARKQAPYGPDERLLQIRMAFALAEIGDPRAIPALEDLIKLEPSFSKGFVAEANAKMRLEQQSK